MKYLCTDLEPSFLTLCDTVTALNFPLCATPRWAATDAEIKVPSDENTELKGSPFKALSRSVYCRTCYAYCQEFLSCQFLPAWSIHLHFFQPLPSFCQQFLSC